MTNTIINLSKIGSSVVSISHCAYHTAANLIYIKKRKTKMLSITYSDKEKFEYYRENGYAYKNGIYDFTFEGRFLIYHCIFVDSVVYIAFDMKTRLSSEVMRRFKRVLYTKSEYIALIPKLYAAIKYTGDKRYVSFASSDPMRAIEAIFRDILTKYGFKVREEQVRLSKNMY